jgi:hypothetical protein
MKSAEEMARNIAHLKGKKLEEYVADAEAVLPLRKNEASMI